jgi:hypothetical protein
LRNMETGGANWSPHKCEVYLTQLTGTTQSQRQKWGQFLSLCRSNTRHTPWRNTSCSKTHKLYHTGKDSYLCLNVVFSHKPCVVIAGSLSPKGKHYPEQL